MPYQPVVTSPNIEKLFQYLQRSKWQNVSSNFSGFVRKEFDSNLKKLEEEDTDYKHLKLMVEFSEMGKFTEAKNMIDQAYKDYQEMLNRLTDLKLLKSPRRATTQRTVENSENHQRRETYTPDKRGVTTPQTRNINTPNQRQTRPQASQEYQPQGPPRGNPTNQGYEARHHEISDRSPRTPQYPQHEQQSYDPHRENFDSLRLKSPEKPPNLYLHEQQNKYDTPRNASPVDHTSRPGSYHHERRSPAPSGVLTNAGQMASNKALWGREHGDRASEKVGFSTYKNDFPSYAVDNHERKDKEAYRQNFGSLAERDLYRGGDDSYYQDEQRRPSHRYAETPDFDNRPSELAKRFKDLHSNEWTDAYDEICREFGSEKTVRHLLWIVTEASLISTDIADRQLRELERESFGVMTNPGNDHHGGYLPRNLGDTLPASKNLLIRYRKQTSLLSIPYVKQECRDKISRTLIESSGFPKQYLADASRLTAYIYKCAELVWLMCVQDPPIILEYITKETEGARFNHEHYHVYTKSGTTYDFGVWPMLRIGKRGHILAKGIAQGI